MVLSRKEITTNTCTNTDQKGRKNGCLATAKAIAV